jgi:hypothetical protein
MHLGFKSNWSFWHFRGGNCVNIRWKRSENYGGARIQRSLLGNFQPKRYRAEAATLRTIETARTAS